MKEKIVGTSRFYLLLKKCPFWGKYPKHGAPKCTIRY
jgi:hypothetical protein